MSLEDEGIVDGVLDGVLVVVDGVLIELPVVDGVVAGGFAVLLDGVVVLVSAGRVVVSVDEVCA